MTEKAITSRLDALLTLGELSRNGKTKRIEPCQLPDTVTDKNGKTIVLPHCRNLNDKHGCITKDAEGKDNNGYVVQDGQIICPLQRGALRVVSVQQIEQI